MYINIYNLELLKMKFHTNLFGISKIFKTTSLNVNKFQVVAAGAGQVNANKTTVNGPDDLASQNSPLEIGTNSEEENLHPANKKKKKADRKKKDKDSVS